mmetsp:Transcript_2787/g.4378  ORF Transcript_2787/g.4378 Transcript_2787/m.4378 type:complete len:89 (+) Transcript_2787:1134-1400(+)
MVGARQRRRGHKEDVLLQGPALLLLRDGRGDCSTHAPAHAGCLRINVLELPKSPVLPLRGASSGSAARSLEVGCNFAQSRRLCHHIDS